MASSSELSVEDWKWHIVNGRLAQHLRPKEQQSLGKIVAAANQERQKHQVLKQSPTACRQAGREQIQGHGGHAASPSRQSTVTKSLDVQMQQLQLHAAHSAEYNALQQQQHQRTAWITDKQAVKRRDAAPVPITAAQEMLGPHQWQFSSQQLERVPAARRVLVDQQQKWQRISEWTARDSAQAAAASDGSRSAGISRAATVGSSSDAASSALASNRAAANAALSYKAAGTVWADTDIIASIPDLRYSLDTAMMELEAARNRTAALPQVLQRPAPGPLHQEQLQLQEPWWQHGQQGSLHERQQQQVAQQQQQHQPQQSCQQPMFDVKRHSADGQPLVHSMPAATQEMPSEAQREELQHVHEQQQQDEGLPQQQQQVVLSRYPEQQAHQAQDSAVCELETAKQAFKQESQQPQASAAKGAALRAQRTPVRDQQQQHLDKLQVDLAQAQQELQQTQWQLTDSQQQLLGAKGQVDEAKEQAKTKELEWQQRLDRELHQLLQQHKAERLQLSDRLREAVDMKQDLQVKNAAQLLELQQQLQASRLTAEQAAAEKTTLQAQLAAAGRGQVDLQGRLELAAAEVTQMREAISQMGLRLTERDKAVAAEIQDFQQKQLAAQQQQLSDTQKALDETNASANAMRDALLAIHTAFSPHSLTAALGFKGAVAEWFSLKHDAYEALTARLLGPRLVEAADTKAIVSQVKKLLAKMHDMVLSFERAEAAVTAEQHAISHVLQQQLNALQTTNQQLQQQLVATTSANGRLKEKLDQQQQQLAQQQLQADAKLQAAGEALDAARLKIEQLTSVLQQAKLHKQEPPETVAGQDQQQQQAEELVCLQQQLDSCQQKVNSCTLELQQLQLQHAAALVEANDDVTKAQQQADHAAQVARDMQQRAAMAVQRAAQAEQQTAHAGQRAADAEQLINTVQQQLQAAQTEALQLQAKLAVVTESAEAKDERIKELRAALGGLMQSKQVREAALGSELQAAQQALASSQQRLQQEQQHEADSRQQLQMQCICLQQQLVDAGAREATMAQELQHVEKLLWQVLTQVHASAKQTLQAAQTQPLHQGHQQQPMAMQLQQLARDLADMSAFDKQPDRADIVHLVPAMLEAPQLIVCLLLAGVQQQHAAKVTLQAALEELTAAADSAAGAASTAATQLSQHADQHTQNTSRPTTMTYMKQQQHQHTVDVRTAAVAAQDNLQVAMQCLQAAMTAAEAADAKQRVQAEAMTQQVQQVKAEREQAQKARQAAADELRAAEVKAQAAGQELTSLKTQLKEVQDSSRLQQSDLMAQLAGAKATALAHKQAADVAQNEHEQAAQLASKQAASQLDRHQAMAAEQIAAVQQEAQQLEQELQKERQQKEAQDMAIADFKQQLRQLNEANKELLQLRKHMEAGHLFVKQLQTQQQQSGMEAKYSLLRAKSARHALLAARARHRRNYLSLLKAQAAIKQQSQQLQTQQLQLQQGAFKLKKLESERDAALTRLTTAESKLQDTVAKLARADGLVPRLEDRCNGLGFDKRKLQEQVMSLTTEVASLQEKLKVVTSQKITAQTQAETYKRDIEQLKARRNSYEANRQQLLQQLADAEAGLRSSKLTSSRLLQEGQRLEQQVQQLSSDLNASQQQLQQAAAALLQVQQEVYTLQSNLLQQTAVAEAARGQLAAIALTQQVQAMLAAPKSALASGTAHAQQWSIVHGLDLHNTLLTAMSGCTQLVLYGSLQEDPKVQRIQELRMALAAALTDAASGASTAATVLPASASDMAADPKCERIQELTKALLHAAAQVNTSAVSPLGAGSIVGSSKKWQAQQEQQQLTDTGARQQATSDSADLQQYRMQELRAALADAVAERDNLQQELVATRADGTATAAHKQMYMPGGQQQLHTQKVQCMQTEQEQAFNETSEQLKVQQMQQQLATLQNQLASVRQAFEDQQRELEQHQEQLASSQQQLAASQQQLAEEQQQHAAAKQQLWAMQQQQTLQQQQLLEFQQELAVLQAENPEHQHVVESQQHPGRSEEQSRFLQQQVGDAQAQVSSAQAELSPVRHQLEVSQREVAHVKQKSADSHHQTHNVHAKLTSAQQQLVTLNKQLAAAPQQAAQAQQQRAVAQEHLQAQQQQLENAHAEVATAKQQLTTLQQQLAAAQLQAAKTQSQLAAAQHQLVDSEQQGSTMQAQLCAVQHELVTAQQELLATQHDLAQLQQQHEAAQQQLQMQQQQIAEGDEQLRQLEQLEAVWLQDRADLDTKVQQLQHIIMQIGADSTSLGLAGPNIGAAKAVQSPLPGVVIAMENEQQQQQQQVDYGEPKAHKSYVSKCLSELGKQLQLESVAVLEAHDHISDTASTSDGMQVMAAATNVGSHDSVISCGTVLSNVDTNIQVQYVGQVLPGAAVAAIQKQQRLLQLQVLNGLQQHRLMRNEHKLQQSQLHCMGCEAAAASQVAGTCSDGNEHLTVGQVVTQQQLQCKDQHAQQGLLQHQLELAPTQLEDTQHQIQQLQRELQFALTQLAEAQQQLANRGLSMASTQVTSAAAAAAGQLSQAGHAECIAVEMQQQVQAATARAADAECSLQALIADVVCKRHQIQHAQSSLKILLQRVKGTEQLVSQLQLQKQLLASAAGTEDAQLLRRQTALPELQQQLAAAKQQASSAEGAKIAAEIRLQDMQQQLDATNSSMQVLQKQLKQVEFAAKDAQTQASAATVECTAARQQLSSKAAAVVALQKQAADLHTQLMKANSALQVGQAKAMEHISQVQQQLAAEADHTTRLQKQLQESNRQLWSQMAQQQDIQQQAAVTEQELQTQLQSSKQQASALQTELQAREQQLEHVQQQQQQQLDKHNQQEQKEQESSSASVQQSQNSTACFQAAEMQLLLQQQANQQLQQQVLRLQRQLHDATQHTHAVAQEAQAVSEVLQQQWAGRVQQLEQQLQQALQEQSTSHSELAALSGLQARLATLQQQLIQAESARLAAGQEAATTATRRQDLERELAAASVELYAQKQLVSTLQAAQACVDQSQQQQLQGFCLHLSEPQKSMDSHSTGPVAAQQLEEMAQLTQLLARAQEELRDAVTAAEQAQQEARALRRQLTTSCRWPAAEPQSALAEPTSPSIGIGAAAAAGREAILAAENKDLVQRLAQTHQKLKLLRSRSQQRQAMQDAQVLELKSQLQTLSRDRSVVAFPLLVAEASAGSDVLASEGSQLSMMGDQEVISATEAANMRAEMQAYKKALAASQEEAAAAVAAAAEAHAQAEALSTTMQVQNKREALRQQVSQRFLRRSEDTTSLENTFKVVTDSEEACLLDNDLSVLVERLDAQQQHVKQLTMALEASNSKRAELAKANVDVTRQLAEHDQLLHALREEASEAAHRMVAAQEAITAKDKLIQQLRGMCTQSGAVDGATSLSQSRRASATDSDAAGLSAQSSKGVMAPHHGVGKVVSAWRESGKLKDLKIEELNFQLGQAVAQLEAARQEAADLQQQLADSRAEAAAGAGAAAAAQARADSQMQALKSQLVSKDTAAAAAEARLAALEAELTSANKKLSALEGQLMMYEAESTRLAESATAAAARLSACQADLAAARNQAATLQQGLDAMKQETAQASAATVSEHQRLSQLEGQVAQLAGVCRQLFVSVSSSGGGSSIAAQASWDPPNSEAPAILVLSNLIDLLAAELTHKLRGAASTAAHVADLEARLAARTQELTQLQNTLKAQCDKIFSQSAAVGRAHDEMMSLRGQLEARAAQHAVIEVEIARQVDEYGRLKQQLVNQEELQAVVAAQAGAAESAAARCCELEAQLAAVQAQAAQHTQRLTVLKAAADGAAAAQAEASIQRQEALASLEVARAELDKVQQQLALAQAAAERKGQEVRELNHMLKAWEAMRVGKDAQIAALMERCKRNEEDAAEKARTVDALRRKLAMGGRPCSAGSITSSHTAGTGINSSSVANAGAAAGLLYHPPASAGVVSGGIGGRVSPAEWFTNAAAGGGVPAAALSGYAAGAYGSSALTSALAHSGLAADGVSNSAGSPSLVGGLSALRRSWAAGSSTGSPARSVNSYGY